MVISKMWTWEGALWLGLGLALSNAYGETDILSVIFSI